MFQCVNVGFSLFVFPCWWGSKILAHPDDAWVGYKGCEWMGRCNVWFVCVCMVFSGAMCMSHVVVVTKVQQKDVFAERRRGSRGHYGSPEGPNTLLSCRMLVVSGAGCWPVCANSSATPWEGEDWHKKKKKNPQFETQQVLHCKGWIEYWTWATSRSSVWFSTN